MMNLFAGQEEIHSEQVCPPDSSAEFLFRLPLIVVARESSRQDDRRAKVEQIKLAIWIQSSKNVRADRGGELGNSDTFLGPARCCQSALRRP